MPSILVSVGSSVVEVPCTQVQHDFLMVERCSDPGHIGCADPATLTKIRQTLEEVFMASAMSRGGWDELIAECEASPSLQVPTPYARPADAGDMIWADAGKTAGDEE
jgi:hypothetical protein